MWTHNPFPHTTGHNWITLVPEKEFFSEPCRPRCHRRDEVVGGSVPSDDSCPSDELLELEV